MQREEFEDIIRRLPENDLSKLQLVLRNGYMVAVDAVIRFENSYCLLRGREGGTTEEGRGFFVPYEDVCAMKLERAMKLSELNKYYGVDSGLDSEDRLLAGAVMKGDAAEKKTNDTPKLQLNLNREQQAAETPPPANTNDPAQIAKNNLLARIRAARTAAGVAK